MTVFGAPHRQYFMLIAYHLGFTNRKRKYFEEKMTATLKSKQTSIATVRNHLRTLASFPTPLIFHWSLPLKILDLHDFGPNYREGNRRYNPCFSKVLLEIFISIFFFCLPRLDFVNGHICLMFISSGFYLRFV